MCGSRLHEAFTTWLMGVPSTDSQSKQTVSQVRSRAGLELHGVGFYPPALFVSPVKRDSMI